MYNVYVKEFAGWVPDIKETDSTTYSNSEMDKHDKHDEKVDDNVPLDNEEGEIPNNDDCEWEEHANIPQGTHEEANHDLPEDHISSIIDEKVMKDDPVLNPKSPGLEAHNSNGNSFSSGGPHLKSKQASHFSFAPPMPSRNILGKKRRTHSCLDERESGQRNMGPGNSIPDHEGMAILSGRKSVTGISAGNGGNGKIRLLGLDVSYMVKNLYKLLVHDLGMSILSGQKSVPGMNSCNRGNGKKDYSVFTFP
nr:hypothetical protein [Tanacetum cinerariifolium]